MTTTFKPPVTVALTGASGAQYGLRLIDVLVKAGHEVWVMISKAAHMVIATETDVSLPSRFSPKARSGFKLVATIVGSLTAPEIR